VTFLEDRKNRLDFGSEMDLSLDLGICMHFFNIANMSCMHAVELIILGNPAFTEHVLVLH